MKLRSMEEKISYRLFLMGFLGLIFTAVLCIFVFHKAFTAQAWSALERETDLVRAGYEQTGDPTQLSAFVTDDLRVTLISQDGSVLFESATDQPMENHLTRPEIRDAIANGEGRDIRDSQTMGYETYYYALRLSGGDVLRVAQDAETVWSIYDATIPAIVLSCVALMLAAAVLAALLTKALVQPVLNMTEDLDHIQENVPYRELIPFAESIHSDRILRENNEKMRQEFTANVSHELKTPLTSISGYAELIETGIAKPEDVPDFGRKIHSEATRMIQLVNDILQLSKLDTVSETGDTPVMETVDLLEVAKECVERQKLNARRAYISLTYLGESAPVLGSRALLDELCQNLCDNAIRYNRPGGKVQIITTCNRDGHCSLTVADNGIGIPREAQASVFERFYRVDKSRSKATGGTGLGLAIVKHIARIHNARIADNARRAVIGQGSGLQHIHAVVIDLGGNGHGQLGVGLPHRVAVAGKHRFIGQANALHSLFHGGFAGGCRHLFNGHSLALGHNVGIADVGIGGHRDGIAGDTGQGIIHLGKGCHAQLFGDSGGHHVPHHFRVDQISNFGISICHRISPLINQFLRVYLTRSAYRKVQILPFCLVEHAGAHCAPTNHFSTVCGKSIRPAYFSRRRR